MNSRSKYAVLVVSLFVVVYAIAGGMMTRVTAQTGSYQQLSIFNEVLSRIQGDYVDDPSVKEAFNGAIRGLIESVDVYGAHLSAKEVAFYQDFNVAKGPGIGVTLSRRFGYPFVVAVIPGGPADKSGLKSGDMIESIDALTTRELNLVQVQQMLSTPVGKAAKLSVVRRRRAEPDTIEVARETYQVPAIEARMLDGNIAYVRVPYITAGKAAEAKKQLDALMKRGATKVLLDLRFTTGVDEKEGVELANAFIESGTIGSIQGQKVEKKTFIANPKDVICKLPLAVLINQGTAGTAELVAGAVVDNARGQLVGTKTFGMGHSQKLLPLDDGSALLISVARYYTPTGKDIHEAGIKATVEVAQADEEVFDPNADDDDDTAQPPKPATTEDRQLQRAIEILSDPSKATKKAA